MTPPWSWDLDRIHEKGYADEVVDLMVGKLNNLPAETQEAFASPQLSHEFHWGNCQPLNLCIFRFLSGEPFFVHGFRLDLGDAQKLSHQVEFLGAIA